MNSLLSLANVHRVCTRARDRSLDVFVFDHHRTAFLVWAWAARQGRALTLLTLDRHMDLEAPMAPPPALAVSLEELDGYARWKLSPRNDDHVLAALEAGAVGDTAVIARSHAPASLEGFRPYVDRAGRPHRFAFARTLEEASAEVSDLVRSAERIALDIDLDCFTTLSDADPEEVVPWDAEHIDGFLRPPDSQAFWEQALAKVAVVTIAREPYHCGGLGRAARLWNAFAHVFFERLLHVPPP
jgi:hypothetical protein